MFTDQVNMNNEFGWLDTHSSRIPNDDEKSKLISNHLKGRIEL